jgi:photosystem II stability/assembly factor-like uncharacterized protein
VYRIEWPGPDLLLATGRGLLLSRDMGVRFERLGQQSLPEGEVRALALSFFYPLDPVLFAAVGSEGVWRSEDRGQRWRPSGLDRQLVTDLIWIGSELFAAADGGVYRSRDTGRTWERLAADMGGQSALRLLFPYAPNSTAETLVATTEGVHCSFDGGRTWRLRGLTGEKVFCLATFPARQQTDKKN